MKSNQNPMATNNAANAVNSVGQLLLVGARATGAPNTRRPISMRSAIIRNLNEPRPPIAASYQALPQVKEQFYKFTRDRLLPIIFDRGQSLSA